MHPVHRFCRWTPSLSCVLLIALAVVGARPSGAQPIPGPGDWGDAPEGGAPYPDLGVAGQFPTCSGGPAGFIWHGPVAPPPGLYLGNAVDFELDGNAGFCPPPPYEMDESWGAADGDGGLRVPTVFTINAGNQVVPNTGPMHPTSLGATCQTINLNGPNPPLVIDLHNTTGLPAYLNIAFDWDQNGHWGDVVQCPSGGQFYEHAIVNLPVPPFYIGLLEGLSPGAIRIGPNPGYVWMRVTLSNDPVGHAFFWDGSGQFDMGETEDYLLRIDDGNQGEFGDAPEDVVAYPSGVVGAFPTCLAGGPAGYVFHAPVNQAHFGPGLDFESEGNHNHCPPPTYDLDECYQDGDAGLLLPACLTLDATAAVTRCPNSPVSNPWVSCSELVWGVDVDIEVQNDSAQDRLVNVLVDWDQNGQWGGAVTCPAALTGDEHVLVDFPVPAGFSGPLSLLGPPRFLAAGGAGLVWCRFTISDAPVGARWDGSGRFDDGETEDYLLAVSNNSTGTGVPGVLRADVRIDSIRPNPCNPRTTIAYSLAREGEVTLTLHDAAGRTVRTLRAAHMSAGSHEVVWDGRDDQGRSVASGMYVARIVAEGQQRQAKLVLLK